MFIRASAVFAILAVTARVVVAQPPACVLAAVNTQDDPTDFHTVCTSNQVVSYLSDNCGSNLDAANQYFTQYCKDAGVTPATSSSSQSASGSSSGSSHGSTASASASEGGSSATPATASGTIPTPTESGTSTSSTGGAARLGMDIVGMAAVGFLGVMVAM